MQRLALDGARAASGAQMELGVNTFDGDTADGVYTTVTGLSAEAGDDGQVGRGNRVNGLTTPYRPMSLEAAAGKNPVTHVGKLYNVIAGRIARRLVAELPEVQEAHCYLLSRIGRAIDDPQLFDVKAVLADPGALPALAPRIEALARAGLAQCRTLWREAVKGRLQVW